eukprot:scaffold193588_cov21-Tisochrysis_lutea.AAC.1
MCVSPSLLLSLLSTAAYMQVQVLRSELLACSNMVDRLQAELQLARTQCSSFQRALWMSLNLPKASNNARCTRWSGKGAQAASKSAHVDTHMDELHSTIQQLTQSKARMQSSMLEQITSFRSQLEVVAEENKQLRHELTLLNQAAASRVSSNESVCVSCIIQGRFFQHPPARAGTSCRKCSCHHHEQSGIIPRHRKFLPHPLCPAGTRALRGAAAAAA